MSTLAFCRRVACGSPLSENGRIDQKDVVCFITYRHETIRIISVRRARPEEEERYVDE